MIDLYDLINSKEFKERYENASPEEKMNMDVVISSVKKALNDYTNAIEREIQNRREVGQDG